MKYIDRITSSIARVHLSISDLHNPPRDRFEFFSVTAWRVKAALAAAFEAGIRSGLRAASGPDLPTPFDDYEVHGVKKVDDAGGSHCEQVADEHADFWILFGHIPDRGLECIGDFSTRELAEEVFARITGRSYADNSNTTKGL